jgi:hypothetical protein
MKQQIKIVKINNENVMYLKNSLIDLNRLMC